MENPKYKVVEIDFGIEVEVTQAWLDTVLYALRMANVSADLSLYANTAIYGVTPSSTSKLQLVTAKSEIGFEFPYGFERVLDALVDLVCADYDKANPTMHMWPSGCGSKPKWSARDSLFLGRTPDEGAPASGEPEWDDSTFQISCSVQPDTGGNNPWNPQRKELKEAGHVRWREKRPKVKSLTKVADQPGVYSLHVERDLMVGDIVTVHIEAGSKDERTP